MHWRFFAYHGSGVGRGPAGRKPCGKYRIERSRKVVADFRLSIPPLAEVRPERTIALRFSHEKMWVSLLFRAVGARENSVVLFLVY
jgi:hypothetical protein